MIVTELPDTTAFNTRFSEIPDNFVFYAHSDDKYFYPEHRTPYLFITNFINYGKYLLNKRQIEISDKCFYFLNENDNIEIQFNKPVPLKTLGIVFKHDFVNSSLKFITSSDIQLLENIDEQSIENFHIPSVPFELSQGIRNNISRLLQNPVEKEDFDNILFEMFSQFVLINNSTLKQLNRIDVAKKSTKEELYKRLILAKDFINDNLDQKLTIEQIAQEACLNKFHFLYNFKKLFTLTPYQYLIEIRLNKAYQLLESKKYNVTEVCYSLGFESIGSFSNTFKKKFQVSPSALLAHS